MKINISDIAEDIFEIIEDSEWQIDSRKITTNGSVYIDIFRYFEDKKEWATIRVADHKQEYSNWLNTYSISPYEISPQTLVTILGLPFGAVGDIL